MQFYKTKLLFYGVVVGLISMPVLAGMTDEINQSSYQREFKFLDADGNGKLSPAELKKDEVFDNGGFSKAETENALIDLDFLGIKNVLALRGDAAANEKFFNPHPHGHRYAEDLVKQIVSLNNGSYMEDDIIDGAKTDFCIGVAGYPEKHMEAPNMETDIYYLKRKLEFGADGDVQPHSGGG